MDRMFRDDEWRVRADSAPSFTAINHIALNLIGLKSSGTNDFLRARRKIANWDDDDATSLAGD